MVQAVPGLVTSIDLCKMWVQDHNQDQSSYANELHQISTYVNDFEKLKWL